VPGDGCCPAGCSAAEDDDCTTLEPVTGGTGCDCRSATDSSPSPWLLLLLLLGLLRRRPAPR
jgi:MYXO-CTERM domain-containing protein